MATLIQSNRVKHMHGVAEYMYNNAEKYNLNKEEMYLIGFIHDIGYIKGKPNHEEFGAELLGKFDIDDGIADIIRYHGTTPTEYKEIHSCTDSEIPKALILMQEADMHVDLTGEDVGFKTRLENIGNRLGFDSDSYKKCKETIDWLLNTKIK